LLLSLAGCAAYAPPSSGPTARIKFDGGAYAYIDETSTAGKSCSSVPQSQGQNWREQLIRADRRLWIQHGVDTRGSGFGINCGFVYSFVPEKDVNYASEYKLEFGRCSVILKRQLASGVWVPEPSAAQEPKGCW
jgi:hypothetical protein